MMKRYIILCLIICFGFSTSCHAADIKVTIDSRNIEFDVSPIIQNDRTLVPMRKIFEELGCDVEWLSHNQTIIATKNSKIIAMQVGKYKIISTDLEINATKIYESDVAPVIYNNRTLIPVRVISESLGYKVEWNDQEQTVAISTY